MMEIKLYNLIEMNEVRILLQFNNYTKVNGYIIGNDLKMYLFCTLT